MKNLVYAFSRDLDMPIEDFIAFRDFILEKSGIYFAENKMYLLTERLSRRMVELGINSFRDYFYLVKYDISQSELQTLMNLITTPETSFLRNEPQWQALVEEVIPSICERKAEERSAKTLRFWSAGCSTGEEPYTLAMMLREHLPNFSDWTIEILANDISEEALRKARQGEYTGSTLRKVPPELLNKYFEQKDRVLQVVPEIREMVKFAHFNLNEPQRVPFTDRFDLIFCRNVMIYFAEPVKRTLIRNFYNSLKPGGYFFIGHAETLHGLSKAFKLVYFRNALVYQKDLVGNGITSTQLNHEIPALTKQGKK